MATVRDFQVNNGLEVNLTANVVGNTTAADYLVNITGSTVAPAVVFNFNGTQKLDSRITFIRSSNATFRAANGMIAYANTNVPRFNYNSNGYCDGLLIEHSRTNEALLSTNIGNTAAGFWYVGGGVATAQAVTLNAAPAPDGSNTATFFHHTAPTISYKSLGTNFTTTRNRPYAHSVFIKSAGESMVNFVQFDGGDNLNVLSFTYTFATNQFTGINNGSANCAIIGGPRAEAFSDGWVRISYVYHYSAGAASRYTTHKMDLDYNSAVVNSGILVWGAQIEWNDRASSLIPTGTVAATRAAEFAYIQDTPRANNLTSWYNSYEGTVGIEWNVPTTGPTVNNSIAVTYSGYPGPICTWIAESGQNVSHHIFYADATAAKTLGLERFSNGTNIMFLGTTQTVSNGVFLKTTYTYSATNFAWAINGGQFFNVAPSSNVTPSISRMDIGRSRANWLDGHVKSIKYWPTRLSTSDIINSTL